MFFWALCRNKLNVIVISGMKYEKENFYIV